MRAAGLRRHVSVRVAELLVALLLGVGLATAAAPSASAGKVDYPTFAFDEHLAAHTSERYCFHFPGYADVGPVAVTAMAGTEHVILRTLSVDLEHRSGKGWVYCATIADESAAATDFEVFASAPPAVYAYTAAVGELGARGTQRYCFSYANNGLSAGPVIAAAASVGSDIVLTVDSTAVFNDSSTHYCATITNGSGVVAEVILQAKIHPLGVLHVGSAVSVAASSTKRWCYRSDFPDVPVVGVAEASSTATALRTVSTDREDRGSYGWVNCVTVANPAPYAVTGRFEAIDRF